MSDNLPINVENQEDHGTITYATEVISTIVGVATAEVEGVAGMAGAASFSDILGRSKNISRGVKVEVGAEEVSVEVFIIVDYGMPIQKVCQNVQDNVVKSIETMTGLHVIKVDVHVQGVSFEKENKELQEGQEVARMTSERVERMVQEIVTEEYAEFDLDGVMQEDEETGESTGDAAGETAPEAQVDSQAEDPEAESTAQDDPKSKEHSPESEN